MCVLCSCQNLAEYLDETDFLGIGFKALSAAHYPILSNYPMRISTNTAARTKVPLNKYFLSTFECPKYDTLHKLFNTAIYKEIEEQQTFNSV